MGATINVGVAALVTPYPVTRKELAPVCAKSSTLPRRAVDRTLINMDRFLTSIQRSGECWLWVGRKDRDGYGLFYHLHRDHLAHRIAYVLAHGEMQPGEEVHHTCERRLCVRPDHLVALDKENHNRIQYPSYDPLGRCLDYLARLTAAERAVVRQALDALEMEG